MGDAVEMAIDDDPKKKKRGVRAGMGSTENYPSTAVGASKLQANADTIDPRERGGNYHAITVNKKYIVHRVLQ